MGGLDVKGLRVPKASDVLAERLRHEILEGSLDPGAALPPERTLAEDSGLSRTVVREALRILEIEGLITIRPGRNGGSIVRQPDADSFTRSLDVFIRGRKVRFHAILEAREQLEPVCAQLAAERRTAAELRALTDATEAVERQLGDVSAYLTANVDWHVTVARISHNELLSAFMEALATAVRTATDIKDFNSRDVRKAAILAHRRVLDAITDGDGPRARHLMERHVQAYRTMLSGVEVPDEVDLDRGADAPDVGGTPDARVTG
jgi:GntR family transcriptional repressor for pyruvate dehydrogenase complex